MSFTVHSYTAAMPSTPNMLVPSSGIAENAARGIERFLRSPFSLLLAVVLAFILNSNVLPLTDIDEGAFSEATREMLDNGNLVSPTLNGEPRHDKPILVYWAQAVSVSLIGQSEFAFRLPSILAATLWMVAVFLFSRRYADQQTAVVAGLVMTLSLMVSVVAKAAIADALLNLFLCLALFGIYEFFRAGRDQLPALVAKKSLVLVYACLALGFLTKGPVAVLLPLLVGSLFFLIHGEWRRWVKVLFFIPGWVLFLVIVLPWHVMIYLDQGDAFFRGFYLQHNLNRYTNTFEGHGGNPLYYLVLLPFILLPFSGWLMVIGRSTIQIIRNAADISSVHLERFLLIWFAVVFVFFSFSRTQLPHYLLYGCTPLFILLARHRLTIERRLLAFSPVLLASIALVFLPLILAHAASLPGKPFEKLVLGGLAEQFSSATTVVFAAFLVLVVGLYLWRRLPAWQGLVLAGFLQACLVAGFVAPRVLEVTQEPVKQAAFLAKELGGGAVSYHLNQPSFSVYRGASTPSRLPVKGELVLFRADRHEELANRLAPLVLTEVFRSGFVVLAKVIREDAR